MILSGNPSSPGTIRLKFTGKIINLRFTDGESEELPPWLPSPEEMAPSLVERLEKMDADETPRFHWQDEELSFIDHLHDMDNREEVSNCTPLFSYVSKLECMGWNPEGGSFLARLRAMDMNELFCGQANDWNAYLDQFNG